MSISLTYGGLDLAGSTYKALLAGADLGYPVPITSAIRSLYLDGSIVSGRFSDNRGIAFDVLVTGATASATAAALDALAYQVDQATNTLTYTPDSGLPVVFDTFRGSLHEDFSYQGRSATVRYVKVSFPAWPFGRTPGASSIAGTSVAAVPIDGFEESPEPSYTASGFSSTPMTRVTTGTPGGPYAGNYYASAGFSLLSGSSSEWVHITSSVSSLDVSGMSYVQVAVAVYLDAGSTTSQTFTLTLSSASGTSSWQVSPGLFASPATWNLVTFDLTATPTSTTGSGYTATAVTGYTLAWDGTNSYTFGATGQEFFVDALTAYPAGYGALSSADAALFTISPVAGSANTPVSLKVSRGGVSTLNDLLVYQAPVDAVTGYKPLLTGSSPYATQSGVNLKGTFTIIASIKSGSQSTVQSVAVSIQQTQGGSNVGSAWASGTVATTAGDAYIRLGEVTLPLVGTPTSNTGVAYVCTLTTGASVVLDLFLLDTRGSLSLVGPAPVGAAKYFFVDEPAAATGVGGVFTGSLSDESDATSALGSASLSGGQLSFQPGSNSLVICSTQASSDLVVTATYSPRWLTERTA